MTPLGPEKKDKGANFILALDALVEVVANS